MIYLSKKIDDDFLNIYTSTLFQEFLDVRLSAFLKKIPIKDNKRIDKVFSKKNVTKLLVLDSNSMELYIKEVFKTLPEIYEYYCTKQFHLSTNLPEFVYEYFDFRKRIPQKDFDKSIEDYIEKLSLLPANSLLIKWAIFKLTNLNKQAECKNIVKRLRSLLAGKSNEAEAYPPWVTEIKEVFNYENISKEIAYRIVEQLDVSVCPYCNENSLYFLQGILGEKDYRPALDHYYPKSIFPFLALSIYNFIPTCDFCNKTGKGTKDTFHTPHAHPHMKGVCEEPIFIFDTGLLFVGIDKLNLEDVRINLNSTSEDLDNNFKLFKIKRRYNANDYKQWFLDYINTKDMIESYNPPETIKVSMEMIVSRNINRGIPATKTKHKKFSLDLYNQILDKKAKLND